MHHIEYFYNKQKLYYTDEYEEEKITCIVRTS